MTGVPEWMRPPRPEGWYSEDLDRIAEAPRHTELIDGALVFMLSPQQVWHARTITALANSLTDQAPDGIEVDREITIRLDKWNRLEPDLLAVRAPYDPSRTFYAPEETLLVVEVVSPESAHRDRNVKLRKYADAGIANYWRVEDEGGSPRIHAYELGGPGRYVPTGIHRDELHVVTPFPIKLDLDGLVSRSKS